MDKREIIEREARAHNFRLLRQRYREMWPDEWAEFKRNARAGLAAPLLALLRALEARDG